MIKRHKKLSDDKPTGFCFWCGEKLNEKRTNMKYCHEEHRTKYYERHYAQAFRRWIYELRGHKCEVCGKKCKEYMQGRFSKDGFQAHHKIPLSDNGELFNPENIILLCHDCHLEAHRLYRLLKKILKYLDITFGK